MKIKKIEITYDCPDLKEELSKDVDQDDFFVSSDIYGDECVEVYIRCKCREIHYFELEKE